MPKLLFVRQERTTMETETNRLFGQLVGRLIDKQNLKTDEAYRAFRLVLNNEVNDMQQGAFLAA
jgi:anthranilate phosphoribosyltransferase